MFPAVFRSVRQAAELHDKPPEATSRDPITN